MMGKSTKNKKTHLKFSGAYLKNVCFRREAIQLEEKQLSILSLRY